MATLIVRRIDEETKTRLVRRAAENGRSMEAEVRDILKTATKKSTWVSELLELAPRFAEGELELPRRSVPRELNLFDDGA